MPIASVTAITDATIIIDASMPRVALTSRPGVVTATAIAATVTDPDQLVSGRQFAAWLGLTPQQHSTGGKTRLGGILKQGDRYLRRKLPWPSVLHA